MRESSQPSPLFNRRSSTSSAPKKRLNFFGIKSSFSTTSQLDELDGPDKIFESPSSDNALQPLPRIGFSDLEPGQPNNYVPSSDCFTGATHYTEYIHLRECIERIKEAPSGTDPKKVDAVWDVYKKIRDVSLLLCKSLLRKSQENHSNPSLNFSDLTLTSSYTASTTDTSVPFDGTNPWVAAVQDYKNLLISMRENLRASLSATYKAYETNANSGQLDAFLRDKVLREKMILEWRAASAHKTKTEELLFWEQYEIRSLNYDRLELDLKDIENLFVQTVDKSPNRVIREYIVAKDGDIILEFANDTSDMPMQPILRFRVSSHLLAASSSLFAQFLMPQKCQVTSPAYMADELSLPFVMHTCEDGIEVKLYRMPQVELNKDDAFTILLHAVHMQHSKVPRQIDFPVFVSIADVCLRYQCTSPVELQVEYQWLPQWIHMLRDENIDGFLLISYAFGLRRIFTRMSKSAILNAIDDEDIQNKRLWPQAVRDKIKETRAIKVAQVTEYCTQAVNEYFRPPAETNDHQTRGALLQLSSATRCPRNSHLCDAANLGWLMLVYNELQLLPEIFPNTGFCSHPSAKRSLKELFNCLRLISSAPQVHPGICDYALTFRSCINDISNSVCGLTLRDVSGMNGWALSKNAGPSQNRYSEDSRDLVELEEPLGYEDKNAISMFTEEISSCILSHLDDLDDLNSAAMINKTFYQAYKKNETMLLKSVMGVETPQRTSYINVDFNNTCSRLHPDGHIHNSSRDPGRLSSEIIQGPSIPPKSFYSLPPPSLQDPESIVVFNQVTSTSENGGEPAGSSKVSVSESNEKYLAKDMSLLEDKTQVVKNEKSFRDEKDQVFGLGNFF